MPLPSVILRFYSAKRRPRHAIHPRRFPVEQRDRAAAVPRVRRRGADSRLPLPPAAAGRGRRTGSSPTCSRSGWRATITSGAPCGPTAWTSGTAPATPSPEEKFLAWARTVPHTLRNPLYHWTHLELKRYFGIDELLDEPDRAGASGNGPTNCWPTTNCARTASCASFTCKAVCTTDDPTDDLACAPRDCGHRTWPPRCSPASVPTRRSTCICRRLSMPGWPGWRRSPTSASPAGRFRRRAAPAARFLPRDGRPALRSRPERRPSPISPPTRKPRAIFELRARRPGGHARGTRPLRRLPDAAYSDAGTPRRAGPSSFTWARGATTTPGASASWARTSASIPSAIGRRPTRWAHIWTGWTAKTRCPKW